MDKDKQTISFRIDSDQVDALDALAGVLDRDRSYLLKEAVRSYLDVQKWHLQQIQAGIRDAQAGKTRSHAEVRQLVSRWRRH
jgi:RHH-type transcriptional regulator, rel operon repressor / antitoxin RelB